VHLDPVSTTPAYELVLEQLRRSINLGHFAPGEKLPPERDLARQLGVSRTTVREAVRVLEGEGVVEVRRGSTGGILVLPPASRPPYLRRQLRAFDDVIDFRIAVESMAARRAAERRTRTDERALRQALVRLEELAAMGAQGRVADWLRADTEYHLLIARIARNARLLAAVEEGRVEMFHPVGAVWGRLESEAHAQHAAICQAIIDGDREAAASSMTAHLEGTRRDVHASTRRDGAGRTAQP
jgi:DNA-binding FadR family transcriptional regulator